jgi:methylmalonyl-CoA/ethylmalonyl-CoA epimerase
MLLDLSHIGQIALGVSDIERSERFFGEVMGFRKLYRFGDLSFFDCAGGRLLLEKARSEDEASKRAIIYFRCADISLAVKELKSCGLKFHVPPHLIAKMDDHDLFMAFFTDPDGHVLALMQEAPKGYTPPSENA